jgi:aerobic-type carbon monoxide dehydrogenase small subunit (CoxS/CutS family)
MDEIKAGLAGNLCRCGTYGRIFEAVGKAAKTMASAKPLPGKPAVKKGE